MRTHAARLAREDCPHAAISDDHRLAIFLRDAAPGVNLFLHCGRSRRPVSTCFLSSGVMLWSQWRQWVHRESRIFARSILRRTIISLWWRLGHCSRSMSLSMSSRAGENFAFLFHIRTFAARGIREYAHLRPSLEFDIPSIGHPCPWFREKQCHSESHGPEFRALTPFSLVCFQENGNQFATAIQGSIS